MSGEWLTAQKLSLALLLRQHHQGQLLLLPLQTLSILLLTFNLNQPILHI
jgi:hypothetical protein